MLQIQPISESSQTVKWWSIKTETNTAINLKDISLKSIDPQHIGYFIRFITGQQVRWQISAKKTQLPSITPGVSWPTPAKPTLPIPLKVFYFVNSCIGGDKYKEIMEDHLRKIKSTGVSLASNFELNLACVSTPKTIQIIHKMCQDIFPELCARKASSKAKTQNNFNTLFNIRARLLTPLMERRTIHNRRNNLLLRTCKGRLNERRNKEAHRSYI